MQVSFKGFAGATWIPTGLRPNEESASSLPHHEPGRGHTATLLVTPHVLLPMESAAHERLSLLPWKSAPWTKTTLSVILVKSL